MDSLLSNINGTVTVRLEEESIQTLALYLIAVAFFTAVFFFLAKKFSK